MNEFIGDHAERESAGSATEPDPVESSARTLSGLDALERRHLERMLRAERLLPVFLRLNLGVAATLVVYYSWSGTWSGVRAVLVLLILLSARAHLRQVRSARLLRKLSESEASSR